MMQQVHFNRWTTFFQLRETEICEECEALCLMQLLGDLLEMKKKGKADYKSNKFYFLMQKSG